MGACRQCGSWTCAGCSGSLPAATATETPITDGGPAFPQSTFSGGTIQRETGGMSLRDYFAAQALQGLCARLSEADIAMLRDGIRGGMHEARVAYQLADAMLKNRGAE